MLGTRCLRLSVWRGRRVSATRGSCVQDISGGVLMGRRRRPDDDDQPNVVAHDSGVAGYEGDVAANIEDGDEPIPQDTLVCALTAELRPDKPEERILQSLIEQLHREYRVELSDMERDVKIACLDSAGKKKTIAVGIAVYERSKPHHADNITRVVLVGKANAKGADASVGQLDLVLSNLSEARAEVYGV